MSREISLMSLVLNWPSSAHKVQSMHAGRTSPTATSNKHLFGWKIDDKLWIYVVKMVIDIHVHYMWRPHVCFMGSLARLSDEQTAWLIIRCGAMMIEVQEWKSLNSPTAKCSMLHSMAINGFNTWATMPIRKAIYTLWKSSQFAVHAGVSGEKKKKGTSSVLISSFWVWWLLLAASTAPAHHPANGG